MILATFLSTHPWVIVLAVIWTIPWKGVALWRAAQNQSIPWFMVFLIINTLGILEILYIFVFSRETTAPQPVAMPETQEPEKIVLDTKSEEMEKEKVEIKEEETKSNLDDPTQKS
jgi:hypothetical protein